MVRKVLIKDEIPKIKPNVSCIGYFDGLHLGHQKLIKETIKQAKKLDLVPTLICFNPDPIDIITNKRNKHILDIKSRYSFIEKFGIEQIIVIRFNENLMKLSPNLFIQKYLNNMNIEKLVCGFDFTFGYKGKGNADLLKEKGKFETIVIPEVKYRNIKISSTRIKKAIEDGDIKLVNRLLGYNYNN